MKKLYILLIIIVIGQGITFAQNVATPNPSFENWTQVGNRWDPDDWNTLNPNTGIIGVLTCTRATGADVHSGTYAIKLTTKSVFGVTANGIASTATLITSPPYGVTGGIPFTLRPDSIIGWYKCTPGAADSGFVQFVLLGAASDTIGFVRYYTPGTTVATYTRFSAPITYFSSNTPTLSYWILSSSNPTTPVVNSSIIFDDIDLVWDPSGIGENSGNDYFHITGNVIDQFIEMQNNTGKPAQFLLYDNSGRLLVNSQVPQDISKLDVQQLRSGIYIYKFEQHGLKEAVYGKLIKL